MNTKMGKKKEKKAQEFIHLNLNPKQDAGGNKIPPKHNLSQHLRNYAVGVSNQLLYQHGYELEISY